MPAPVNFWCDGLKNPLRNKRILREWLLDCSQKEQSPINLLNYILVTDEHLLQLNRKYLQHDYYTDILTFDLSDQISPRITGDIFISVDRVRENAIEHEVSFQTEMHRVIVHGLLHLIGYKDGSEAEKAAMRAKEDACLSLLPAL